MCGLSSILLLLILASPSRQVPQASLRHLHASFAVRLYRALAHGRPHANVVVSPAGVAASLGLLQLGAKGTTLAQLEDSLGYDLNDVEVREPLLQWRWQENNGSGAGAGLRQTCVLLVQSGVHLAGDFLHNSATWAHVTVMPDNFSLLKDHGRQTSFLRPDEAWPLQAGSSSGEPSGSGEGQQGAESVARWGPGLQMALVNTVVFKGVWQKQFSFSSTLNLPFVLADGTPIKVPMMHQATQVGFGEFRTGSEHRYAVLELPYLSPYLSLQVVLPRDKKTPLSSLETQLSVGHMTSWEAGLRRTKMDVFLPRFNLRNKFNLRWSLPVLGVTHLFSPAHANFSGMSQDAVYVSDAFHDVTIQVTEDGTKAAAATAMVLLKRSRAAVFKVDRPFLFLLRHMRTGSILFIGRVMNPSEL
ncbi:probable serpin E3 [Entelurus aequoreus]|uniref:probable serpin E3 n=1 Tax=Entelurus aequoreus TaxID=161455 RepID=UPI002B1D82C1|nr:probable serpin E3 [Entelurus aequoreus]